MSKSDRRRDDDRDDSVSGAVSRLEEAVNDLVASAGESAADHIERAAERIRAQVRLRRSGGERNGHRADYRHRRRLEPAWLWSEEPRSATLYRDTERGKLLGVCAGIGRYYGIEAWVVRCVAITGLIFLNWIVVVAYLVAGFVLDAAPKASETRSGSRKGDRRGRRGRFRARRSEDGREEGSGRYAAASPGQQLRAVAAEYDEAELRLRRMETHITSGSYELHREFGRLGDGDKTSHQPRRPKAEAEGERERGEHR